MAFLTKIYWRLLWLSVGIGFIPGVVGAAYGLRAFQEAYIPVIDEFQVQRFGFGRDGALAIRGVLRKRFDYCRFDAVQWWVTMPDGLMERVGWDSADQKPSAPRNRPAGFQTFGPWTIYIQKFPQGELLTGIVDHVCLAFWPTRTRLGPINLIALRADKVGG